MKLLNKFIILAITSFAHQSAIAKESFHGKTEFSSTQRGDVSVYGSVNANKAQFENLTILGDLNFKKLKVTDSLTINGFMNGMEIDCNKLILNGTLMGSKIIIRDGATINGGIDADNLDIHGYLIINVANDSIFKSKKSNFEKIVVSSAKVEFDEVISDSIEFEKSSKKAELYLSNASLIKGDIVFKSGDGIVKISEDSKIEGEVKGGRLLGL